MTPRSEAEYRLLERRRLLGFKGRVLAWLLASADPERCATYAGQLARCDAQLARVAREERTAA